MFIKTFFTDAQISDVTYKQSAMFTHWYYKNQIYLFCFTKQTFGLKKSLMHFNLSKLNPSQNQSNLTNLFEYFVKLWIYTRFKSHGKG